MPLIDRFGLAQNQNRSLGLDIIRNNTVSPFTEAKLRKLCDIISSIDKKDRLADVGCFDGRLFEAYVRSGVKEIDGFDIIPEALEAAGSRAAGLVVHTYACDLEKERAPVPDATYDIVVCADVIEHLFNTRNLASECYRILKPGGISIFLTPNLASMWNRYLAVLGKMPLGHPGVSIEHKTESQVNLAHSRIGTLKEWKGLFLSEGFKVLRTSGLWSGKMSWILSAGRTTLAHTIVIECSK